MDRYPANYSDDRGSESTSIVNDGETLRISLRGLEFVGSDFDSLEPPNDTSVAQIRRFSLNDGYLCSCRIECKIPIPINDCGGHSLGTLVVEVVLGDPVPNGGLDREHIRIVLEYGDKQYVSPGTSGWFEDELLGIQAQLPDGVFMRACINCLSSDYSPAGHGMFGSMMCFRNLKGEYLKIGSKQEFWSVHDRYDRMVQETFLCPEFERRIPGTGYRG
jgi:hypothetical protein